MSIDSKGVTKKPIKEKKTPICIYLTSKSLQFLNYNWISKLRITKFNLILWLLNSLEFLLLFLKSLKLQQYLKYSWIVMQNCKSFDFKKWSSFLCLFSLLKNQHIIIVSGVWIRYWSKVNSLNFSVGKML
jgi:hypothetical protein